MCALNRLLFTLTQFNRFFTNYYNFVARYRLDRHKKTQTTIWNGQHLKLIQTIMQTSRFNWTAAHPDFYLFFYLRIIDALIYLLAYLLTRSVLFMFGNNNNLAIANRSRVSCINTNYTMTLKSGLEVTQGH